MSSMQVSILGLLEVYSQISPALFRLYFVRGFQSLVCWKFTLKFLIFKLFDFIGCSFNPWFAGSLLSNIAFPFLHKGHIWRFNPWFAGSLLSNFFIFFVHFYKKVVVSILGLLEVYSQIN